MKPDKQEKREAQYAHDAEQLPREKPADKPVAERYERQERHPLHGRGVAKAPPKGGHGGKFTWEGPTEVADSLLAPAPAAIDEGDPNYADEAEAEAEAAEKRVA